MSNPARTGTQKALHVVSIIMIVLGVLESYRAPPSSRSECRPPRWEWTSR